MCDDSTSTGFNGVFRDRYQPGRFFASYHHRNGGVYDTAEEAARAHDLLVLLYDHDTKHLNFPHDEYSTDDVIAMGVQLSQRHEQNQERLQTRKFDAAERMAGFTEQLRKARRVDHDFYYQNSDGDHVDPFSLTIALC